MVFDKAGATLLHEVEGHQRLFIHAVTAVTAVEVLP